MVTRKVMIGGNWWSVEDMSDTKADRFLKSMDIPKAERKRVSLRGYCDYPTRTIAIDKKQGPEEHMNTLMHEGLHAIINEMGSECGISKLNKQEMEHAIYRLSAEILGYLKQVDVVE